MMHPGINQKLSIFSLPRTSKQVARELGSKKISVRPFLERDLVEPLNPGAEKGRLYTLTDKARKLLDLPEYNKAISVGWDVVGWTLASPKQRYVVLKTVARDYMKRTSEDIRWRSKPLNPCLTRISTKETLKELIREDLVETEKSDDRRRYYWINDKGRSVVETIDNIFPDAERRDEVILSRRGYSI